jgi:poly(3-hydroxybutyrate) depolymerase
MKNGVSGPSVRNGSAAGTRLNAIPIIVFHGDRDTTVHPRNGEKVMAQNIPQTVRQPIPGQGPAPVSAATRNDPAVSVLRGKIPNGHAYTQTTHQNHDGRVVAEHWLVHGASHAWSGGSKRGSYTDAKGPNASEEMMRFFSTQAKKP